MKTINLALLLLFFTNFAVIAQRQITPSETLKIEGKIKAEKTFSVADLEAFPKVAIADQTLYSHKGEVKSTVKDMKGVLLKTVLESIQFDYGKPKELNEFYFVFVATDGYKVVFSWNEIYNTEAGNNFYIVTEMEGKKLKDMEQRILFISTADLKSGRRYIKALEKIQIRRLE
ncbi:molybdopterin-binding protein [Flavobacterium wongokense]|uniref:molybdopterin-binding protein n=1 Tax=Flavobacterium wongokense TaxID=2910674 RepID=UPI001F2E244E|nr:molybdopterin-binding protein [Flavobacterium sp. WG47]MCF6130767.1 molybdopterin-binding protein [Flavobacterium sp. WG47]